MRRALASAAAAVLALTAAAVPLRSASDSAPSGGRDAGCPSDVPVLLAPAGPGGSPELGRLVVCSDRLGTVTLISNGTDAVWTIDEPSPVALHRLATSSLGTSFLRLFPSPRPAVPSGATVVVARPPSEVEVRIDADLTLAQLAHDELAASLAVGSRSGGVLDRYGDLLGACLAELLAEIGPAEPVLLGRNPARRILGAALRLATADEVCAAVWRAIRGQSLEEDLDAWRGRAAFAARVRSASTTYAALAPRPEVR